MKRKLSKIKNKALKNIALYRQENNAQCGCHSYENVFLCGKDHLNLFKCVPDHFNK